MGTVIIDGVEFEMTPEQEATLPQAVPVVPSTVTNFQARAALMGAGLFDAVDAAVKAAGGVALQAWEYANEFEREGVLVAGITVQLGITSAQLDALFVAASEIAA